MRPAGNFGDRARLAAGRIVQRLESGITIGLEQTGECGHVGRRVLAAAVGAVKAGGGRRCFATERPVVADIDPQPPGLRPTCE
jgi:hypothetical protein